MDMSKLPRLSNSQQQQNPAGDEPATPPPDQPIPSRPEPPYSEPPMTQGMLAGAEAWLSIVIGVILLMLNTRFLQFVTSKMTGGQFTWTFNDASGNAMAYTRTVFFWNDLGIVVFAACLIFEGLVLAFLRQRWLLQLGFVLTILAIALNVFTLIKAMPVLGFQFMPALVIAFGVYIAMYEWALLKATSPTPRRAI